MEEKVPELLFAAAKQQGLKPRWLSRQGGLIAWGGPEKHGYLLYGHLSLNSQLASKLARDKHLTHLVLADQGLPAIPYLIPGSKEDLEAFLREQGAIVVKPVRDTKPKRAHLIRTSADLAAWEMGPGMIAEKYVQGTEWRYLVLNGEVLAVHERRYAGELNLGEERRISYAKEQWDRRLLELSLAIAQAFGLNFCAVDFLVTEAGQPFVLEVNSAPGLGAFHYPDAGPSLDLATQVVANLLR